MIRINLLKPEIKELKEKGGPPAPEPEVKEKKTPPLANIVLIIFIVVLAGLFFLQKRALDMERKRLAAAQEEKRQLAYVSEKLAQLQQQKTIFEKKINLINSLKAQQPIAVIIMDEISRCLPDWVWLTQLTYDNGLIQIRGNALSNNLIADFIRNLEDSPYLENVDLKSSAQRQRGQEETTLEFALTLRLTPPPSEKVTADTSSEKPAAKEKKS